jgi:hypothetical protein
VGRRGWVAIHLYPPPTSRVRNNLCKDDIGLFSNSQTGMVISQTGMVLSQTGMVLSQTGMVLISNGDGASQTGMVRPYGEFHWQGWGGEEFQGNRRIKVRLPDDLRSYPSRSWVSTGGATLFNEVPPVSSALEERIISGLLTDLNNMFDLGLDTKPKKSHAGECKKPDNQAKNPCDWWQPCRAHRRRI